MKNTQTLLLKSLFIITVCVGCFLASLDAAQKPEGFRYKWRFPEERTHVLWVGGGHWHDTLATASTIRAVLEKDGEYHVTYTEEGEVLTRLEDFDVIVLNGMLDSLKPEEEKGLLDSVRAGKPLLVLHAASACFRKPPPAKVDPVKDHPEFYKMLGGHVLRHPPFGPFEVKVLKSTHPVTDGVSDFVIEDELFIFGHLQEDNNVLLEAEFDGKKQALSWTRQYGSGEVFHLSLGHNQLSANNSAFQKLIYNGLTWLTRD